MKHLLVMIALLGLTAPLMFGQTGSLTGMKICIDPGHGGHNPANDRYLVPDPGTEFWESESNFQKALLLRTLLQAKGAVVYLTRETNDYPDDALEPSLAARVAFANANSVDWFHSIHSNATGVSPNLTTNYTLMLVREKRPGGPASSTGNGLGVPETQEAWDISGMYMSPLIKTYLRTQRHQTYLDWTFYGGTNGGFSLGVLRGLLMPGELSEGSMHDYYPETRRLMNQAYRKIEAYALLHSFMRYKNVPADPTGIAAGILTDFATSKPVNFARVRVLPENRVYVGDGYNNGFYAFDSLGLGPHTLRFETPGYRTDSVQVFLSSDSPVFVDRTLEMAGPPAVLLSTPVQGDTAYMPNGGIALTFTKSMDTASVRPAFSIAPTVPGRLQWSATNALSFIPDTVLPMGVWLSVRVESSARSAAGEQLDGNADGTAGDPYVLNFKTRVADVFPPALVRAIPGSGGILQTSNTPIAMVFDELLDAATVNISNIAVQLVGGSAVPRIVEYAETPTQGMVTLFLPPTIVPGGTYRIRVSNVADKKGNVIPSTKPLLWEFTVSPDAYTYTVLDSLFSASAVWGPPDSGAGSTGYVYASFLPDAKKVPGISGNPGSGKVTIEWDTVATPGLVRIPVTGGPARISTWGKTRRVLQTYLYGDGSNAQFRFCVADSVEAFPAGTPTNLEVSTWRTIDWAGWRMVNWDLERDSVGSWVGNGRLEGQLRFDSYQFRRVQGLSRAISTLYLDQLELAERVLVGVEQRDEPVPGEFALEQNYPNPFNPATEISCQLPVAGMVNLTVFDLLGREVARLVDGRLEPGRHLVRFDAGRLASGVYVYRLKVDPVDGAGSAFVDSRRMLLIR